MRSLAHIAGTTAKALFYIGLLGVILFFALTRTQVGRDGLRTEIERQFERQFEGQLRIGALEGNLVYDLYARDVQLYDEAGSLVAQADSVVARPSWRALFDGGFALRTLSLHRPVIDLERRPDGRWNLQHALAARQPSEAPGSRNSQFSVSRLQLTDASIRTHNPHELPEAVQQGWLFDYTNTSFASLQARAALDWSMGERMLVDLYELSADLPEQATTLQELRGHLHVDSDELTVSKGRLQLDQTDLELSASLPWESSFFASEVGDEPFDLTFQARPLDNDEIKRFIPRLPFADLLEAEGRLHGTFQAVTVDAVQLRRGNSTVTTSGQLASSGSAYSFEADTFEGALRAEDVRAVVPAAELDRFEELGLLRFAANGTVDFTRPPEAGLQLQRLSTELDLASDAGTAQGTLSLDRRRDENPWHYAAHLNVEELDLASLLRRPALQSRLNGELLADGTGLSRERLTGSFRFQLDDSELAGRSFSRLSVEAEADSGNVHGQLTHTMAGGTLRALGRARLSGPQPAYELELFADHLDLGPLLLNDSLATNLNATAHLSSRGTPGAQLEASLDVAFDSSAVRWGQAQRTIVPQRALLQIAPNDTEAPAFQLVSDAVDFTLTGDVALRPLESITTLWVSALQEAVERERDKPYAERQLTSLQQVHGATAGSLVTLDPSRQQDAAEALSATGSDTLALEGELLVKRSDLLAGFFPTLPPLQTDLQTRFTLAATPSTFNLEGQLSSTELHLGAVHSDSLNGRYALQLDQRSPRSSQLSTDLRFDAGFLRIGRRFQFRAPRMRFSQQDRSGRLQLSSASHGDTGPFRLVSDITLLPDRLRLSLQDAYLRTGPYTWRDVVTAPIDLYSDALNLQGLQIMSESTDPAWSQELRLQGTLSHSTQDTVSVVLDDLLLNATPDLLGLGVPLGGVANGQLAVTGGLRSPEVTGDLLVDRLTFDNHHLGQFRAFSRYVPGSSEIALSAMIRPAEANPAPGLEPELPLDEQENHLDLNGTVLLPGLASEAAGTEGSPGALNLNVAVERANAFFFDYIFSDIIEGASGHLTGTGHIGGTFQRPIFSADMNVVDGSFRIPDFNLDYELSGPVSVDREAIRLDGVELSDPTEGRAVVNGAILFNDYEFFSFDLSAELNELQIINVRSSRELPFYGRIWASGPASLNGPLNRAVLRSSSIETSPRSELFIPITEDEGTTDTGFLIFADAEGQLPDLRTATRRRNVLADRPVGERTFLDGLELDLNVHAPSGSTVHLVFDPLLGDAMSGIGSGRIQLLRQEGEFQTFGTFEVDAGEYLFTAGELFFRRFQIDGGTITWDGNPADAELDITASYRTRASRAGLTESVSAARGRIPLVVQLHITDRVSQPTVDLSLAIDRSEHTLTEDYAAAALEAILNQSDRETEYATSVLLTNTFLLTTELPSAEEGRLSDTGNRLAFNSLSQLVASQLNRYLSEALPNVDVILGVQGENPQHVDLIYGVALRLLDERLIIRGEGVWSDSERRVEQQGIEGEFIVEVRLSPGISVEAFYRREGSVLAEQVPTSTTGAGVSYQTQFSSWQQFFHRLFGWLFPSSSEEESEPALAPEEETVASGTP